MTLMQGLNALGLTNSTGEEQHDTGLRHDEQHANLEQMSLGELLYYVLVGPGRRMSPAG